ncbi:hypothetical protein DASC09_053270 [Saccharomycopsis crataegensis]|uniref:Uncharacterized protein n=1 Tax=Saccharomycopsis crataegensis TaxID=43959 RepID=A0AAV5QUC7_9ASCO|nr:hypothetical protein DASC09_053270 [Saccharomycopsis crataegensis]
MFYLLRSNIRIISRTPCHYRSFGVCVAANKSISENIKHTADTINHKLGDIAINILDKAESAAQKTKKTMDSVSHKSGEQFGEAKDKLKHEADAKLKTSKNREESSTPEVKKNFKGYDSLADKGKKVESEQNRADDGL